MAVCNLLMNELKSDSGNFILFSQYVDDVSRNYVEDNNWKVIPTRFVALNIDYSKADISDLSSDNDSLNVYIPRYFQNYFENGCAYGKTNLNTEWTPEHSKNLFWNSMFDGKFLHATPYGSDNSSVKYVPEIMYCGDINMHSYNEHQGMGYGEIYCYIPADGEKMRRQVECITDKGETRYYITNSNSLLEGHTDKTIGNYSKKYYYNPDFEILLDATNTTNLLMNDNTVTKYEINTFVVLYSVFCKTVNGTWETRYSDIPMGIYFAGNIQNDATGKLTNPVTKYVTTSYSSGTAYGLRICTRFAASVDGVILTNSEAADDHNQINMCQLMTAMNENLSLMNRVTKASLDNLQGYKELLSIIKNNRTNVPYVKQINGSDYWFVNGKMVSKVDQGTSLGYGYLSDNAIKTRLEQLSDNDADNDYLYIPDPLDNDAVQIPPTEIADALGIEITQTEELTD